MEGAPLGVGMGPHEDVGGVEAGAGADPTELMTLQLLVNSKSSVAITWIYDIEITYHCEWFDPIPLTAS